MKKVYYKRASKYFSIFFILCPFIILAQSWNLKLKSTVELRTFILTNKVDIKEDPLPLALITLYKGTSVVNQMQSDVKGQFAIDVPANGEFILVVSYAGCNSKKFAISTMDVPSNMVSDKYAPVFEIEGVIMAKAFVGVNYSILQQPLAKIGYIEKGKKFGHDESYTNQMLDGLEKIWNDESDILEKFTSLNNAGDMALSKGNCPLAKSNYEKAMTIIVGEKYPTNQLLKVGDCLKGTESQVNKAAAEKLAQEKVIAEKLAQENATAEKLAQEKATAEKLAQDKSAAEKLAQERVLADKIAQDKAAAEKLAKEKANTEKLAKEKTLADKLAQDKIAAEKLSQEKAAAEKLAQEKAAAEKLALSKAAAEKSAAQKVAQEKAIAEKQAQEKAKSEKQAKENTLQEKLTKKALSEKIAQEPLLSEKNTPKPVQEKVSTETAAKQDNQNVIVPVSSNNEQSVGKIGSNEAKYSISQTFGDDRYKELIKRGDELFKMKRYPEAKPIFEEALSKKPGDAYSTKKLAELEKLIQK